MFFDSDLAPPVFTPAELVQAAVLATVLQHPDRLAQVVASGGKMAWFQRPGFRCLWEALTFSVERYGTLDPMVAWVGFHRAQCEHPPGCKGTDPCHLWGEFAAILERVTSASMLTHLCSEMRALEARDKALGLISEDIPTEATALSEDLSAKSHALSTLAEYAKLDKPERQSDLAEEAKTEIEKVQETGFFGLECGIVALDQVFGGFRPSEVIICGARPSVGKSSFAVTVAVHNIRQDPERVILFASAEMRAVDILKRVVACHSGVSISLIESGKAPQSDRNKFADGFQLFENSRLIIQHNGMTNPQAIAAIAKNLKLKHGRLDLVIVDHIHILRGDGRSSEERVASVSKAVRSIAVDLAVPVLALAQLNRNVEHREDPAPTLADLRASGAIEEDGSTIFFLHRPKKDLPQEIQATVAKNRRGGSGAVALDFNAACSKFDWAGAKEAEVWNP